MSERAHPDDTGFQNKWRLYWRRGIIPWLKYSRNPYRSAFFWRYDWINRHCQNYDLLDIPCGMGWGTSLLKGCRSLTGIDISEDAIAEAQYRYGKRAKFQVGDMARLEFDDESFDAIACLEGIEHIPVQIAEQFIEESARVLRSNGQLFISSPYCRNGKHSGNPHHLKEYQPDELFRLLETYFEILDILQKDVENMTVSYIRATKRS